jgi:hypothetical protein
MLRKENYVFLTEALVLALHKHIMLIPTLQSLFRSQKQPPIIPTVCQNEGKLETIFLKKHVNSISSEPKRRKLQITVLKTTPRSMLHSGIPIQELLTILE